MIELYLGYTSMAIEKIIGIEDLKTNNLLKNIEDILECATRYTVFPVISNIYNLFTQLGPIQNVKDGNNYLTYDNEKELINMIVNDSKYDNLYQVWNKLIHELTGEIDELHRLLKDDEISRYLMALLYFFCSLKLEFRHEDLRWMKPFLLENEVTAKSICDLFKFNGINIGFEEAEDIWKEYSDEVCASYLTYPDNVPHSELSGLFFELNSIREKL